MLNKTEHIAPRDKTIIREWTHGYHTEVADESTASSPKLILWSPVIECTDKAGLLMIHSTFDRVGDKWSLVRCFLGEVAYRLEPSEDATDNANASAYIPLSQTPHQECNNQTVWTNDTVNK